MKARHALTLVTLLALGSSPIRGEDANLKREQDLSAKEGKPAPALQVAGWMNTPGNTPLTLEQLRGKVVVIDFWGTW